MSIKYISAGSPIQWTPASYTQAQPPQFYEKTTDYINCIAQTVGVATREGLVIYPEYHQGTIGPYFIVRHRYRFRPSIKNQIMEQWRSGMYHDTDLQNIIQAQWVNNKHSLHNCELYMEYKIHESQILENGGIVFIPTADCTVGIGLRSQIKGQLYHPGSPTGSIVQAACDGLKGDIRAEERGSDYSYHIRIVDNSGTIGSKWITIGSRVSKIVPVKRPGQRDGFYVTRTCDTDHLHTGDNSLVSDWYEHASDVPEFVISDSFAKATQTPSYEASIKEKLAISERSLRIEEHELKAKKAVTEIEALKAISEKDKLKHKLDMEKMSNDLFKIIQEKDRYELENELLNKKLKAEGIGLWRRFIGDNLKYVPVLITTVITLWKMFKVVKPV